MNEIEVGIYNTSEVRYITYSIELGEKETIVFVKVEDNRYLEIEIQDINEFTRKEIEKILEIVDRELKSELDNFNELKKEIIA